MKKGSQFDTFLCIPTTINVFLFSFSADFQAFSCRILPETSKNLSDEWLKHLHVNFIQRDSDAKPTRHLIKGRTVIFLEGGGCEKC